MRVILTKLLIQRYIRINNNAKYTDEYIKNKIDALKTQKAKNKIYKYLAKIFDEKEETIKLLFEI
jgi:hypothetical protein